MTRSEDFAASNPAGAEVLEVELGADREGNLTGIRTIWCDRGSTDSMGVKSIAAMLSAALPLASPSPHLLRGHDQSRYVRRLPGPDRTARGVRRGVVDR